MFQGYYKGTSFKSRSRLIPWHASPHFRLRQGTAQNACLCLTTDRAPDKAARRQQIPHIHQPHNLSERQSNYPISPNNVLSNHSEQGLGEIIQQNTISAAYGTSLVTADFIHVIRRSSLPRGSTWIKSTEQLVTARIFKHLVFVLCWAPKRSTSLRQRNEKSPTTSALPKYMLHATHALTPFYHADKYQDYFKLLIIAPANRRTRFMSIVWSQSTSPE